jgi:PIN domain nuclease of toxin-antitoxin system
MDTHVWIWWHMDPGRLAAKVHEIILNPNLHHELLLSVISVWEFAKLLEKGRLSISCDASHWIDMALDMFDLRLIQLTPSIAYQSTILPQPFHHDPADQIIVASAREENATLLTADRKLQEYHYVRTSW